MENGKYINAIEHVLLERHCIQDIMSHAVHASSTALSSKLARFMGCLHKQRGYKGVITIAIDIMNKRISLKWMIYVMN